MNTLESALADILKDLFGLEGAPMDLQETRKEFEGDLTLVVFPYLKASRMAPDATANAIGAELQARVEAVSGYNVVKGFLNISLSDAPVQATRLTPSKRMRNGAFGPWMPNKRPPWWNIPPPIPTSPCT